MKVRVKRYLSMLMVVCMCLSLLLYIQFPVMAAYENTHHNTGNQAYDIVEVAKTQLGYTEGSSKDNKYGATFGVNNADWCAFFVSWCAKEAGISTSIIKRQGIASPFSKYFNIPNTHGSSKDYFPKPGDLVFYAQDGGSHYHVGIVETVNKSTGKITTIEGNSYQKSSESKNPHYVCRHTISYNASNVCCYGTPNYTGGSLPTEHTCDYGTFAYYGAAHPHYNYYYCSACGKVNCDTARRTSLQDSCGECFVHDALLSCNYGTYVYYEATHPHYNCYACSTCGKVSRKLSETNYISSCLDCNRPGKPEITSLQECYLEGDTITFGWTSTDNTTHYNLYIDNKSTQGEWLRYKTTHYAESGQSSTLPVGEYRVLLQSTNSNYYEEDGTSWLYTNAEWVYFRVVSLTGMYPEKPEITSLRERYLEGDTITFGWTPTGNTTHYNFWLYVKNDQNVWETYEHTFYVTSGFERTLPIGEYRCIMQSYNSNCWNENGTDWLYTESDYYYFSVAPVESMYPGKPDLNNMKSSYVEGEEIIFEWEATENTLDYVLMLYYKNGQNEWKMYSFHAFTPPIYKKTLPVGEYRCYVKSRNVDSSNNSIYTDSDYYYFMVTEPQQIDSVDLRGTITSFGVADDEVTVQLMQENEEVAKVKTTDGTYHLSGVISGEYTLVVFKWNHVTRTYSLTVSNEDVTLDVKIHLIGDVDGNGKINTGDVAKLNAHLKGSNKLTDEYMIQCANVNSGSLNMGDTAALYSHIKGTKKLY